MVGIVLVSHSRKVAEGLSEMLAQIGSAEVPVFVAGGAAHGRLGTRPGSGGAAVPGAGRGGGGGVIPQLGSAGLPGNGEASGRSKGSRCSKRPDGHGPRRNGRDGRHHHRIGGRRRRRRGGLGRSLGRRGSLTASSPLSAQGASRGNRSATRAQTS